MEGNTFNKVAAQIHQEGSKVHFASDSDLVEVREFIATPEKEDVQLDDTIPIDEDECEQRDEARTSLRRCLFTELNSATIKKELAHLINMYDLAVTDLTLCKSPVPLQEKLESLHLEASPSQLKRTYSQTQIAFKFQEEEVSSFTSDFDNLSIESFEDFAFNIQMRSEEILSQNEDYHEYPIKKKSKLHVNDDSKFNLIAQEEILAGYCVNMKEEKQIQCAQYIDSQPTESNNYKSYFKDLSIFTSYHIDSVKSFCADMAKVLTFRILSKAIYQVSCLTSSLKCTVINTNKNKEDLLSSALSKKMSNEFFTKSKPSAFMRLLSNESTAQKSVHLLKNQSVQSHQKKITPPNIYPERQNKVCIRSDSKWDSGKLDTRCEEGEIDSILAEFFVSQCARSDAVSVNSSFKLSESEILDDMMASQVARVGQTNTVKKRDLHDTLPSIQEEENEEEYAEERVIHNKAQLSGNRVGSKGSPVKILNDGAHRGFNSQQEYQRFLNKHSTPQEIVRPKVPVHSEFGEGNRIRGSCGLGRVEAGLIQHYLLPESDDYLVEETPSVPVPNIIMEDIEPPSELHFESTPPSVEDFICSPLKEIYLLPKPAHLSPINYTESPKVPRADHSLNRVQFKPIHDPIHEEPFNSRNNEQCVPSFSPPELNQAQPLKLKSESRYLRNVFQDVTNIRPPPNKIARKISFNDSSMSVGAKELRAERDTNRVDKRSIFERSPDQKQYCSLKSDRNLAAHLADEILANNEEETMYSLHNLNKENMTNLNEGSLSETNLDQEELSWDMSKKTPIRQNMVKQDPNVVKERLNSANKTPSAFSWTGAENKSAISTDHDTPFSHDLFFNTTSSDICMPQRVRLGLSKRKNAASLHPYSKAKQLFND